ncbi:hypothetical protein [Sphingomonas sp.]|uniref:hypothetical protein n=1 Tax=Sphingomonas sp. TaxID=28214 RepID=UPI0031DE9FB5
MAGASEDGEVNHWPAFVDVLTAVIMVVTFLLVIMSAAVMELSKRTVQVMQQKINQMQQQSERPADAQSGAAVSGNSAKAGMAGMQPVRSPSDAAAGSSIAQLGSPLVSDAAANGKDQLSILTRDTPDTMRITAKSMDVPVETQGMRITTASTLLRVDFDPNAIRYTDEDAGKVQAFLKGAVRPGQKYGIWSLVPSTGSISEPMRIAYYRAAATRNLLIQAGINPGDITTETRVVDPKSEDGNSVRIVVKN